MDNSDQVAQAIQALVRLQLQRDGHSNGDRMDLDMDPSQDQTAAADAAYEATIKAAQEYCLRILGSRMAPSLVSDDIHMSDLIKKKLMREDPTSAKAIRFSHLYTKLSACSVLTKKWSILYFLLAVSEQSSTAALDSRSNNQPLSFLGLHNLDTARTRDRKGTEQADTTMASHSGHGSTHIPSQSRTTAYANLLNDQIRNGQQEVEESALLRDLIFVFQGIDGKIVKFGAESGACAIDPSVNISNATRSLVNRLTELGWLYKKIDAYIQKTLKEGIAGLVGQSFCSALQHELVDYFRLIAVLEAHITKDSVADGSKGLSLKRLLVWTQESLQRLRLMSVLVECCQNLQGGALVSMVHDYTQHGDPLIQQFIHHMLERISAPFYVMMQRWIYEGELEDPRTEFFIAYDPDVEEEDMWQRKYFIREEMLPAFIDMALAKKILSIGKSLNFLRHKCDDADWLLQHHGVGKSLKYGDIAELEGSIDAAYIGTSQRLLHLLVTKFKLVDHLTAIKRYILLGQGDFIQHLMESLGSNLSQPANTLFRHNLTGTLETAIRSSNAQYDDPDVLRRLDVRLLEISPGDSGWDVFSLDYHVDSPINTILTPVAMHQYLKMFNFLWRVKRVEYALSSAWRRQTTSARAIRPILELVPELHHCRIVCSEMIHFVYQLQYYILFEVLECSWDELLKAIGSHATDLDSLIEAHTKYLRDVTSKGLLAASHDVNMMPRLLELLATILDYKVAQDNLYNYALAEVERRERLAQTADRRTRHGQWGLTDQDDTLDRIPDEQFEELIPGLLRSLTEYSMQFKRELSDLLITLSADGDSDLRFLSFRLDFNEFYLGSLKAATAGVRKPTALR
ncbi:Spc98 family-domain-containing protein [Gamsiella multidivaricata]|uniref:Spc98 family-domain-containing protein n=1 Tax=Gamsiella multidivaricata TaxID=101098 RepID=UPI0022211377|nr:Spc98 family-domain-containing protein [Gamsiella multidivaricata]KAI7826489.1 Spc98 family-domain-containing protein [Gamsiella multidivaricata]